MRTKMDKYAIWSQDFKITSLFSILGCCELLYRNTYCHRSVEGCGLNTYRACSRAQKKACAEAPTEFTKLRITSLLGQLCYSNLPIDTWGRWSQYNSAHFKNKFLSFIKSLFVALQLLLANIDKLVGLVGWFWQSSLLLQVLPPLSCPFQQVLLNWWHFKNN